MWGIVDKKEEEKCVQCGTWGMDPSQNSWFEVKCVPVLRYQARALCPEERYRLRELTLIWGRDLVHILSYPMNLERGYLNKMDS